MTTALGIDPGTKSFDLALIEKDKVLWEKSIPTEKIVKEPDILINAIKELEEEPDIITGPSGYGTPIVCNEDIKDPLLFATEILLLSKKNKIFKKTKKQDPGELVYKALALAVKDFWEKKLNVCYIPGVIHLPSIPNHRKFNRIDLGTADKLSSTVLAFYTNYVKKGVEFKDINFILTEMGYGYNAVIKVEKGKITDGYGGTIVPMGFLTIGELDAEIPSVLGTWSRKYNYSGGVTSACKTLDVDEALKKAIKNKTCKDAFTAMVENLYKKIASLYTKEYRPTEIILTGRLSKEKKIVKKLENYTIHLGKTRKSALLKKARISKEAAQGYAIIGEGLTDNGFFKNLIEQLEIKKAKGTVFDWIIHPKLKKLKKHIRKIYYQSLTREAVERIL